MPESSVPNLSTVDSPPRRELDHKSLQADSEPFDIGGQAVVYETAVDGVEGIERVALKEPREPHSVSRENAQRFLDQASVWETVDRREREKPRWRDYEHIVGIVDTGERFPWIAMEYMDGGSLEDRVAAHPEGLPIEEALWIGECLCRGLEIAHSYGIAHLDLKPANILFRKTPDGVWDVPKIADWGVARVLSEQTGTVEALSIEYSGPEQFEPSEFGDPDSVTDIYQLGAVVYTLLTGQPPYTGAQTNVMHDIVYGDDPKPPSAIRNECSETLDVALQLALASEKADRYRNVAQFEEALRAIRAGERLPRIVAQEVDTGQSSKQITKRVESSHTDNTSADTADSWPMFHGGPERTGRGPQTTGPQTNGTSEWTFPTDSWVEPSPAVVDGTLYVGSHDRHVYSLDADTGELNWAQKFDDQVDSSPVVVDGTVYVGNDDGIVYALDADNGEVVWTHETSWQVKSSPAVAKETVYVGSGDNSVYALDADNGEVIWSYETGGGVMSSPAVVDETVYVGSGDNSVYALDADNGEMIWSHETNRSVRSSPAVADGTVYIGSRDHNVYALDADSGEAVWTHETDDAVDSSPAVADGTVYIGSRDHNVYALDTDSGEAVWTYKTGYWVDSSPAVASDTVYVGSHDNSVYALDADSGAVKWTHESNRSVKSSPAVADGTVYVGSNDKYVYALTDP